FRPYSLLFSALHTQFGKEKRGRLGKEETTAEFLTSINKEGSNLRREKPVAVVAAVAPHSLASRLGLQPGDRIVKINGKRIPDLITYQMEEAQEHLVLEVEKENGEYWEYEVEKAESEGLGLSFTAAV